MTNIPITGGLGLTVTPASTTYQMLYSDRYIEADTSSAGFTITLAALKDIVPGTLIAFLNIGTNTMTLDGYGSELINGAATSTYVNQYDGVILVAGADGWYLVANLLGGITTVLDEDDLGSDSDTAIATQQSIKAYIDALMAQLRTLLGITDDGAINTTTGLSIVEVGTGAQKKTIFTFSNVDVALADDGADAYKGIKLYTMPTGWIIWDGAVADFDLTKSSGGVFATWDGFIGLGTVECDAGVLAGTEQDLIPVTATPQAAGGETTGDMQSTATESGDIFDGHATAKEVWLNVKVDDADHDVAGTPCNIIVNGTLTILWKLMGDN